MAESLKQHALESKAGKRHQATPNPPIAYPIRDFALLNHHSMCVGKPRCSSRF